MNYQDSANKQEMEAALKQVKEELGKEYPIIIGGEAIYTDDKLVSENPSNKKEIVGYVSKATKEHVDQAMEAAVEAFKTWRTWTPEERAGVLHKAAAIFRRRKHEFN